MPTFRLVTASAKYGSRKIKSKRGNGGTQALGEETAKIWCRGPESNWLRLPFQGSALPMSYPGNIWPFNSRVDRGKSQTGHKTLENATRAALARTAPTISGSALRCNF